MRNLQVSHYEKRWVLLKNNAGQTCLHWHLRSLQNECRNRILYGSIITAANHYRKTAQNPY
jgi:hypothetical protein